MVLNLVLLPQPQPAEAKPWQVQLDLCVFNFFVRELIKEMDEMVKRFFPQPNRYFAWPWGQIVDGDYGVPVFILAAVCEDFVRFGGLQQTIGPSTEFRVFFPSPDHPLQMIE